MKFLMASKIKRCGESIDNGCGYKQPAKIKKKIGHTNC